MRKSNFNRIHSFVFGVLWMMFIGIGYGQDFHHKGLDSIYTHYQNSISNKTLAGVESLLILNDSVIWHPHTLGLDAKSRYH